MTRTKIAAQSDLFAKYADRMGFDVQQTASGLSASQYVVLWHDGERYKIRFSDHVAKPTYELLNGAADFEIGTHEMAHELSWAEVLKRLGERHGLPICHVVKRVSATAERKRIAAEEQRMAVRQQAIEAYAQQRNRRDGLVERVRAIKPELIEKWEASSGKKRKKYWAKIRNYV